MTWSWGHSPEAYTTLRARVLKLPKKTLEVIFAEWKAAPGGFFHPDRLKGTEPWDERRYERALSAAKYMYQSELAERVWDLTERLSDCTNGGWEAHLCPHHCCPHTIAWSSERKLSLADGDEGTCKHCDEEIEEGKKVYYLADYEDDGPYCSRQCAQDAEHELACEEV